jgi:hypothetical protein
MKSFVASRGWSLLTLTRQGCPPTKGVTVWSPSLSDLTDSCRSFNEASIEYILSRPDVRVVLLAGRWSVEYLPDSDQRDPSKQSLQQNAGYFKRGLASEISVLQDAGKQVIVLEDVPAFSFNPVDSLRNQQILDRRILDRLLLSMAPGQGDGTSDLRSNSITVTASLANQQILDLKAADANLILIDPKQALCRADRCYFANGFDLYYYDESHISVRGAMLIIPLLPDLMTMKAWNR